jgi:hypothetical protein
MAPAFRATGLGSGAIGRRASNGHIDRPSGLNCVVAAVPFDPVLGLVQLGTGHAGDLNTTFRRLSLLTRCAVLLGNHPELVNVFMRKREAGKATASQAHIRDGSRTRVATRMGTTPSGCQTAAAGAGGHAGTGLAREGITRRHNICERLPRRTTDAIPLRYIRVVICSAVGTIRQQRRDGGLVPLACRLRSPMRLGFKLPPGAPT